MKKWALLAGLGFGCLAYYYKDLKKAYGWLPDIPDPRDYLFTPREPGVGIQVTVNLSPKFPSPPENQGNIGSCTAHAVTSALEYIIAAKGETPIELSRLFTYYNTRVLGGNVGVDKGGTLRDALKSATNYGICPEPDWDYIISKWKEKPPDKAYLEASLQKFTSYERLSIGDLESMKKCLSEGYPFVFGFTAYKSLESADVSKTGILNLPKSGEGVIGGHAVIAVGYDEPSKRFLIRNSWGPNWAINGYFTMPYDYFNEEYQLAWDFWTIRKDD